MTGVDFATDQVRRPIGCHESAHDDKHAERELGGDAGRWNDVKRYVQHTVTWSRPYHATESRTDRRRIPSSLITVVTATTLYILEVP